MAAVNCCIVRVRWGPSGLILPAGASPALYCRQGPAWSYINGRGLPGLILPAGAPLLPRLASRGVPPCHDFPSARTLANVRPVAAGGPVAPEGPDGPVAPDGLIAPDRPVAPDGPVSPDGPVEPNGLPASVGPVAPNEHQ